MALYVNGDNVTYFDRFGVEHIPKENDKFIWNKYIKTNIYRIQANKSIIWGYFCIRFIDFILKRNVLVDSTNLFSPNKYETLVKIILKYFQWLQISFIDRF